MEAIEIIQSFNFYNNFLSNLIRINKCFLSEYPKTLHAQNELNKTKKTITDIIVGLDIESKLIFLDRLQGEITNEVNHELDSKFMTLFDYYINHYKLFINSLLKKSSLTINHNETSLPPAVKPKLKRSEKTTKENIAFFCRIIEHAEVLQRGDEDRRTFCQKVCKEFNLEYSERVRINFNDCPPDFKSTDKNFKKVNKLIFPTLTEAVRIKIDDYIKRNSKMYG